MYDFTGYKILMAEDTTLNREMIIDLLSIVHMEVDWVENGKDLLDKFKNSPSGTYVLILMDLRMPILDGFETSIILRKLHHPDAKTIPIIAVTADEISENLGRIKNSGMNGHLKKPIDTEILYQTLEKYRKLKTEA